tara:strand:+ start:2978 stop:3607 length:630 start_codon:yes stop_codon:yes gene_type:complete
MKFSEIKGKINTDNITVLKICENFIDDRLEKENTRGESAERRANMVLGTVGAGTILMVFWSKNIILNDIPAGYFVMLLYITCSLLLVKAVWYSVKSSSVQSRFRVTHESLFEFSRMDEAQALKSLVAAKYYECSNAISPNSTRLFLVQRAQRALTSFFIGVLLLGAASIIDVDMIEPLSIALNSIFGVFLIIWFVFGDWCIERLGIWNS